MIFVAVHHLIVSCFEIVLYLSFWLFKCMLEFCSFCFLPLVTMVSVATTLESRRVMCTNGAVPIVDVMLIPQLPVALN